MEQSFINNDHYLDQAMEQLYTGGSVLMLESAKGIIWLIATLALLGCDVNTPKVSARESCAEKVGLEFIENKIFVEIDKKYSGISSKLDAGAALQYMIDGKLIINLMPSTKTDPFGLSNRTIIKATKYVRVVLDPCSLEIEDLQLLPME